MEKSQCSFKQLPFSSLFSTYIYDYPKLSRFFSTNPLNEEDIKERISRIPSSKNRAAVASAFAKYHNELGISADQKKALDKFSDPSTLAVVTGQQLGVAGGPLYTVFKTMTTIILAKEWEEKLNRPVVPVFWLADEDHDFEEIAHLGIPGNDEFTSLKLDQKGNGNPVSEVVIDNSMSDLLEQLRGEFPETDFTDSLFDQLSSCYTANKTHAQAFAQLMSAWFSKHGLLIVGSNFSAIKGLCTTAFSNSVANADAIHEALESQSSELEKDFHRQVVIGSTNLFYFDENGRTKIDREGDTWSINDQTLTTAELLTKIEAEPQNFSPNVFLRPVLQDILLPTIGYVAGPGEIAYYAQMRSYYQQFDMEMPVIFPRISATLLESGIDRIMQKLPFEMCSYNQRIEDLESQYIEMNSPADLDKLFSNWVSEIKESAKQPIQRIASIDPTLEGTAGKTVSGFENELNKLKGRVFRSLKQQEETQLKRIRKIKAQLFPDGLQERAVNPTYFMNKYGMDVWDQMLVDFAVNDLDLQTHHIVKL
ncbi:MAG: bacillithiol biosynthesis cysteine-adding enzyme BshC [Balneolaceae bacterium]|nr:bacillithiol biosynthesis cysteine-adding enzyme BshC [Balneolaceae bacterium]